MKYDIKIIPASSEDIENLIDVQNLAFYSDYIKYGYCPGYGRSSESMKDSLKNRFVFKIMADGIVVGDIIVQDNNNGNYFLGCLCVIPKYENNGIGQSAMKFLGQQFKNAQHWALETPADKERNHYFYKKFGFQITKEYIDGSVKVVLFEKDMSA